MTWYQLLAVCISYSLHSRIQNAVRGAAQGANQVYCSARFMQIAEESRVTLCRWKDLPFWTRLCCIEKLCKSQNWMDRNTNALAGKTGLHMCFSSVHWTVCPEFYFKLSWMVMFLPKEFNSNANTKLLLPYMRRMKAVIILY